MGDQGVLPEQHPLRVVVNAIPDATILVDRDGRIVAANRQVTSIFGWPGNELEGLGLDTLIPERFREIHGGHTARFFEAPEVRPMGFELDLWALHRDGSKIPVLISLQPMPEGGTQYALAAIRDASPQQRLLEKVRASEERFRVAAGLTADVVQLANVEQDLLEPIGDFSGRFVFPIEEFPRTISRWFTLIHPDDRDRIEKEAARFIETGSDWHLEYRILDSQGSVHHWIDTGVVTELAEDGSILRGIGVVRDVTQEVHAQQEIEQTHKDLATSEGLLKSIFASTRESIAVIDPSGKIIAVNPRWTRFAKENDAPEEAKVGVGVNYLAVCSSASEDDPDAAEMLAGIRAVLDGSKQSFIHDYPCHGPSEERWFTATVTPLQTNNGGAVISHRDITERVKRQQQIEEALAEVESLKTRFEAENVYLQDEVREIASVDHIVGGSDAWNRVLEQVRLVAGSTSTVLLTGETGTGKELIAREVHSSSDRSDHPLIRVNCAALPATLVESELFGHEKGAFTGAEANRQGRFALADKGTIFLDEIGELPLELQAKLLHVLQDGEFEPLGSTKAMRVDARVIAATNRDLHAAVREGRFRSDLYYRLAIFPIELPPLRHRKDDIPLLASYFLTRFTTKHERSIDSIPKQTVDAMLGYDWPGNVRELMNLIERAVIVSQGKSLLIDPSLLQPPRDSIAADPPGMRTAARNPITAGSGNLQDVERGHIVAVLDSCGWRVKGSGNAAELLGLKESTLRSRMKKLGIRRPD